MLYAENNLETDTLLSYGSRQPKSYKIIQIKWFIFKLSIKLIIRQTIFIIYRWEII